jgi:hypothetical protein
MDTIRELDERAKRLAKEWLNTEAGISLFYPLLIPILVAVFSSKFSGFPRWLVHQGPGFVSGRHAGF